MITTAPSIQTDQRVVLHDVSWQTYLQLLEEVSGQHLFLTYDRGTLEIMSPSPRHAKIGKFIARMVETLTLELRIPIVGLGNTTWKSELVARGCEADECYYLRHAAWAAGREEFDLRVDPPPDLVIEVDISSSSIDKEGIYAALKVPELWRWESESIQLRQLQPDGSYHRSQRSLSLPMLPAQVIEEFVRQRTIADDTTRMLEFQDWIKTHLRKP